MTDNTHIVTDEHEMIHITKKDKAYILHMIRDLFKLNKVQGYIFTKMVVQALKGNEDELFHTLRYNIHTNNTKKFSNKVIACMINIYTYLLNKHEADTTKLHALFYYFTTKLYNVRVDEFTKLELRSETVQSVLRHMSDNLNNMLQTQQLMLADISHEMRTSLNAISGYITLITEKKISKQDQDLYLEKIQVSSASLQELVSDILDVSKLNSNQMEVRNNLFWVDEAIMHSIDNVSILAKKKKTELIIDIDCFASQLYGDSQRIMQILTNLLSNAIKFTDSKGIVHLNTKILNVTKDTTEILFSVQDNGVGMSAEEQTKVFEPYTRFQRKKQGVGLGLHISYKLIQKMGGKLHLQSEEQVGSKFEFAITFKHREDTRIDLANKLIYFFNDTQDAHKIKIFQQKVNLFRQHGAQVELYQDEVAFTKMLIDKKDSIPDIISITSCENSYIKFDALINYLKIGGEFKQTYFIAEQNLKKQPLKYFDKVFEYFSNISTYFSITKEREKPLVSTRNKEDTNITILAVDDIETNLDILKLFIQNKYPNIILDLALGGYEAIGMYKTKTYDLIFLDLKMPGLGGFDVFNKLMEIKFAPPVYALTADIYKDTFEKVKDAGFAGLHEKPLKPDELFKTIEGVIDAKYHK